jgi:hypothetical protein
MHHDEPSQTSFDSTPGHGGGAAPADRRCHYTKADGKSCRDWAVRGQDFCYRHGVFLNARSGRGISVPLLEDEASIVLVLSETLRALALGAIPVNNGRLILEGCRLAHTMQMERQKAARLERQARQAELKEEEVCEEAGSQEHEAGSLKHDSEVEGSLDSEARTADRQSDCCPVRRTDPHPEEAQEQGLAAHEATLEELLEEEALAVG